MKHASSQNFSNQRAGERFCGATAQWGKRLHPENTKLIEFQSGECPQLQPWEALKYLSSRINLFHQLTRIQRRLFTEPDVSEESETFAIRNSGCTPATADSHCVCVSVLFRQSLLIFSCSQLAPFNIINGAQAASHQMHRLHSASSMSTAKNAIQK